MDVPRVILKSGKLKRPIIMPNVSRRYAVKDINGIAQSDHNKLIVLIDDFESAVKILNMHSGALNKMRNT